MAPYYQNQLWILLYYYHPGQVADPRSFKYALREENAILFDQHKLKEYHTEETTTFTVSCIITGSYLQESYLQYRFFAWHKQDC
jgi:hypothetical protein